MINRIASATVIYPDISEREEAILRRWTGRDSCNHQIDSLCDWCDEAREETLHARRAARGELEDDDYVLAPNELPEGFEQWLRREVISNDRTLIYKKGNVRGLCYVCGQKVRAEDQRFTQHNIVICPLCGTRVRAILEGSSAYSADYVQNIAALQMGKDGKTLFIRAWHLCRDPKAEYQNIEDYLDEFQRFAIRDDKVAKWLKEGKNGYYFHYERYAFSDWQRVKGTEVYDGLHNFYTGNIRAVTQNTKLQYADIEGYINTNDRYKNVIRFILDFARYPVMEFLQKGGYDTLIAEWIAGFNKEYRAAINKQGKTLPECFKMPTRNLRLLEPQEWSAKKLAAMQWLSKRTEKLNEEYTRIFLKELPFTDRIEPCLRYVNLKALLKYLLKQERSGLRIPDIAYADYIGECEKLGLDLSSKEVLFPRDIHEAHRRTSAQVKYKADEKKTAEFKAVTEKLEKLAYQSGELLIRPARLPKELTDEGKTLHHCVGGYVDRVASGSTAIFFIRLVNYPDKPYYTLELKNKKVQQCYTLRDKTCEEVGEPFVQSFVDEWMKKVVLKKSKSA